MEKRITRNEGDLSIRCSFHLIDPFSLLLVVEIDSPWAMGRTSAPIVWVSGDAGVKNLPLSLYFLFGRFAAGVQDFPEIVDVGEGPFAIGPDLFHNPHKFTGVFHLMAIDANNVAIQPIPPFSVLWFRVAVAKSAQPEPSSWRRCMLFTLIVRQASYR